MSTNALTRPVVRVALFVVIGLSSAVKASELDDLKAQIRFMQQSMDQMRQRLTQLEKENQKQKQQAASTKVAAPAEGPHPAPPLIDANGNEIVTIVPSAVTVQGHASQVTQRPAINDQQEAAPRPNDLTLDPKYRGFFPIPNTPVL